MSKFNCTLLQQNKIQLQEENQNKQKEESIEVHRILTCFLLVEGWKNTWITPLSKIQNPITLTLILYLFFLNKMEERRVTEFRYRVERMRIRVRVLASFIESRISSGRWIWLGSEVIHPGHRKRHVIGLIWRLTRWPINRSCPTGRPVGASDAQ